MNQKPETATTSQTIYDPKELESQAHDVDSFDIDCKYLSLMVETAKHPPPKCVLYYLFINLPFSSLAFVWIWATFFAAIGTTFVPLVGYFFWWLWALSWRSLGRIELLATRLCHDIDVKTEQLPRVYIALSSNKCRFFPLILDDKYTWRCFAYFAFLKWFIAPFTTVFVLVSIVLWWFPPCLPLSGWGLMSLQRMQYQLPRQFFLK
ncbi:4566_t:CDS:2 [Cetraspora pellucida]|uniref:4566_t:CDS:1 n=1 Tax=Cetraspora pellucida TaxID=1433469 RepID=A0A9N9IXU4_9GLOM|nr:4566_t:CDS:2 [Cetraspora pellucida]